MIITTESKHLLSYPHCPDFFSDCGSVLGILLFLAWTNRCPLVAQTLLLAQLHLSSGNYKEYLASMHNFSSYFWSIWRLSPARQTSFSPHHFATHHHIRSYFWPSLEDSGKMLCFSHAMRTWTTPVHRAMYPSSTNLSCHFPHYEQKNTPCNILSGCCCSKSLSASAHLFLFQDIEQGY